MQSLFRFLKYKSPRFFNHYSSFSFINSYLLRSFDTADRFRFFWRTEAFYRGARVGPYRPLRPSNFGPGGVNFSDPYPYAWQDFIYDPTEWTEGRHFFLSVPFFYNALQLEQSHHLMFERGNRKWGSEIGVRYVPTRLNYLHSFRFKGTEIISSPVYILEEHRHGSLTWPMMMDIILLGGPENFLKKRDELYRYWLHTEPHHMQMYDYKKMEADVYSFWESTSRTYFESILKNWAAYAMTNTRDLNRWSKWQEVATLRVEISRSVFKRFGLYRTFLAFFSDLRTGYFKTRDKV